MPFFPTLANSNLAVPAPGSIVPAPTALVGDPGQVPDYSRADHVHASMVQTARLAAGAGGLAVWNFPVPYAVGVVPVITATCECPSGTTLPFVVNVVSAPTNTGVTVQVFRTAAVTLPAVALSLLGFAVNQFAAAPAGTMVNLFARKPS